MNKTDELVKQARAGEQLASNKLVLDFIMQEKARLFDEFSRSKWWQARLRQSVWARLQAVNNLDQRIKNTIATGEMAKEALTNPKLMHRLIHR